MAARGGVDNPLGRQDEEEKALDLMTPVLGLKRSKALVAALLSIEKVKSPKELRKLYRP
jgi:hypothetical protein